MTRYEVEQHRSIVHVLARSSVHAFRRVAPVCGHVDLSVSDGRLDLTRASSGELRLQIEDLQGDMPQFDSELRRRLDTDRYPGIVAVLRQISPGTGVGYRMGGELTLHGCTRDVWGEATVDLRTDGALTMHGTLQLDIREFGLVPPKLLMLRVHPEVEVRLELCATASSGQ
jgi:polyisoprenoid-binding protein YceI